LGSGSRGRVGGFLEEVGAEIVEVLFARRPEDLLVFFSFEALSAEG